MNIYDFAMEREKEHAAFYKSIARSAGNTGLKNIMLMLAEDELKHFRIVKQMKDQSRTAGPMAETKILKTARSAFSRIKPGKLAKALSKVSQAEVYRTAMKNEKMSREFYIKKSKEESNPVRKKLFLQLAEEEKKHYFLLENILSFVTAPDMWIESAEFNHLEDY